MTPDQPKRSARSRAGDSAGPQARHGAPAAATGLDAALLDRLAQQNRARLPERVVHAKGCGALGSFTVTGDISQTCCAALFGHIGQQTPVIARFSGFSSQGGSADQQRDLRGMALRLATADGHWDLICTNAPVFFIRDPWHFPDLVRAMGRDPRSNRRDPALMWDFWADHPESLHLVTFLHSDRGLPASFMQMNAHACHVWALRGTGGHRTWARFHLKSVQEPAWISNAQARAAIAEGRDGDQQALDHAIASGQPPSWRLMVQTMTEQEAASHDGDPFDVTRVWPHGDRPLTEVGLVVLDRTPDNWFGQIEQAAFSPANLPPGIEAGPDPMLQARLFAYADAQRHRLGPQYRDLPVNAGPGGAQTPAPRLDADRAAPAAAQATASDDYSQPRALHNLIGPEARARLYANIAESLRDVPPAVIARVLAGFDRVTQVYGDGVRAALASDRSARAAGHDG